MNNSSTEEMWYPMSFRVLATTLYVLFMFIGLLGNMLVITVVFRVRGMSTPTNCYLVSLAMSDCIFFLSAMPRELMALHQPQAVYVFGQVACALLTYLPYLAINSSSLSITAFTVERYIAICQPMRAKSMCTVRRAVTIITLIWIFSFLWNASWLYLAKLEAHPRYPHQYMCSFRIDRDSASYKIVYLVDFILFYLIPLLLYLVLYGRIAYILMHSTNGCASSTKFSVNPDASTMTTAHLFNRRSYYDSQQDIPSHSSVVADPATGESTTVQLKKSDRKYTQLLRKPFRKKPLLRKTSAAPESGMYGVAVKGRAQVVKMLVVIVCVFAVCWLPYRALVFYNSFAHKPWVNEWFLLVAKVMIVINCAINPILYNLMSAKFRAAFRFFLKGCASSLANKSDPILYNRAQNVCLRTAKAPTHPTDRKTRDRQPRACRTTVHELMRGSQTDKTQPTQTTGPASCTRTNSMPAIEQEQTHTNNSDSLQ